MSLFRRKPEGEDGRDERPPPPPAQDSERNEPQSEQRVESGGYRYESEDRFAGAITAPASGEIVSGLVEVRVRPASPVPAPVVLWLEWSRDDALRDGVSWQKADSGALDDQGGPGAASEGIPPLRWDTGSLPDGACLLRLVSLDSSGAETRSEPMPVQIDNLGPELRLREQLAGRTLSGTVTVSVEAEDLVSGVALVELEISSGSGHWRRVSEARTEPFALRLSTEELADGQYELRISARDGSGNSSQGEPWTVEIANSAGAAELIDPGEHLRGRVNLIARAADVRSTQMVFEIVAAGSGEWRALGTARAPFHLPVDTRQLVDGSYELRIESLNAAGRSTYSRRFGPYTVDNTPPAVAIVQPHEGEALEGWAELVAETRDETSGVVRVELSYSESGEWRPLAELEPQDGEVRGFWQTDECSPGACRVRATAFDRAGNEASDVIAVTIEPAPLQPEPATEEVAPALAREPVRSKPSRARPPSREAAGRFGQVPNWDWERIARAEAADNKQESASAEPVSVDPKASAASAPRPIPQPVSKGVVWHWKGAQASEESPPAPKTAADAEPDLDPESERDAAIRPVEPPRANEPTEVLGEERPAEEGNKEAAAVSGVEEGGSVVNFPRAARSWDIWQLSQLVEGTPGQDPVQQEERRQILYHLREHTAIDGRIPPDFEGLVYEVFGELIQGDSGA